MPLPPIAIRFELAASRGREFASLYDATREPPGDPESRVVAPGGVLLASATRRKTGWVFTAVGARMMRFEVTGEAAQ